MAYQINTTNGALLVEVADGQIDTTSTDITLIGRNYTGFGESINENFVKLLENFANSSEPSNPIAGQLWWDTGTNRLKVYTGSAFTTGGGPIVSAQQPNMVAGDLWINNQTNQISFFDGTDLVTIGPLFNAFQGKSGPEVATVLDSQSTNRTIVKYFIGDVLVGLWSNIAFTPANVDTIPGFTGDVAKGFNAVEADFKFNATSTKADTLIDAQGNARSAAQFIPSDRNGTTSGTVRVNNNGGLTIGLSENNVQKIVGTSYVTENQLTNHDWKVRVRSQTGPVDAIVVDTSEQHVGIFQSEPLYALDVNGDARVTGNLIVEGSRIGIETETLRVKTKNIELGITDDSTLIDDNTADGGGIILNGDSTKEFIWRNATNAWTANVNIDISNNSLMANGVAVLTGTEAPGLTSIGALQSLTVDDVQIDGSTISTSANALQITSADHIVVNGNKKITGVADPTAGQDVATKAYVDSAINLEKLSLTLDVTGLDNTDIASILNDIAPAADKQVGSEAHLHCTDTTSATATLAAADLTSAFVKQLVTVQKLDGGGNDDGSESVIQDLTFTDVAGSVAITVDRTYKVFEVVDNGGTLQWQFVSSVARNY